jgi:long-chain acyl-CoA synthetase
MEAVGNWAERRGIAYAGYTDLAAHPQTYELVRDCVEKVNAGLAAEALMAGTQIHRFLVLHKELDPDDDELTRTRKVRRNLVAQRYEDIIAALYSQNQHIDVETVITYQDGRTAKLQTRLRVESVDTDNR